METPLNWIAAEAWSMVAWTHTPYLHTTQVWGRIVVIGQVMDDISVLCCIIVAAAMHPPIDQSGQQDAREYKQFPGYQKATYKGGSRIMEP